jgi:hypothetical protein
MLQQYVPKYFSCFSLMLQQVVSCCKLQVSFFLDVSYVPHTRCKCVFQVFHLFSDVCCIQFFHVVSVLCCVRPGASRGQEDGARAVR